MQTCIFVQKKLTQNYRITSEKLCLKVRVKVFEKGTREALKHNIYCQFFIYWSHKTSVFLSVFVFLYFSLHLKHLLAYTQPGDSLNDLS
jgi:hypothetical protein